MTLEHYPQYVSLKDGANVLLRPMVIQDSRAVHEFFCALPEEDRQFLRDDVTQPEWLESYITKIDFETTFRLVAELEGRVVGVSTLYRALHGWSKHVAEVRSCVARDFQRQGLGGALMRSLVRHAISMGLEKIIAQVVDNQIGAIRSLEKIGFVKEAVLKGQVKDLFGFRRDMVVMSNDVSHLWEAMEALVADFVPALEGG